MPEVAFNPANPLTLLTMDELRNTRLSLALACGRSRSSQRKKHRQYLCFLFQILESEAQRRGDPTLDPPFKA